MTAAWDFERWPNFSYQELACKCCKSLIIVPEFLDKLQILRSDYGSAMKITSGYRCQKHNSEVSMTGESGPHTTGQAVDVYASGKDAYDLLHLALLHGFTGIGISQKGAHSGRFLHLDTIKDRDVRPTIWSY